MKMFLSKETKIGRASQPFDAQVILNHVLLPEATLCLIQEDTGLDRNLSINVLRMSTRFGTLFHFKDDQGVEDDISDLVVSAYAAKVFAATQGI